MVMDLFFFWIMVIMFLSFFLSGLGFILGKKVFIDSNKRSPFECGFNPIGGARVAFSLQFYLVALIFIIFDVELILLFPVLMNGFFVSGGGMIFSYVLFLILLTIGLVYEWSQGMIDWIL